MQPFNFFSFKTGRKMILTLALCIQGVSLAVLSPGPGRPADFKCSQTLETIKKAGVACFGVCLGLQAMVELVLQGLGGCCVFLLKKCCTDESKKHRYFGGELGVLDYPMHGKPSMVTVFETGEDSMFQGLPNMFNVARYHSLHGIVIPDCLRVTALAPARGEDGGADICMVCVISCSPLSSLW